MLGPAELKTASMRGLVAGVAKRQAIANIIPKVWIVTPSLYMMGM
jgi:hypothetical protein